MEGKLYIVATPIGNLEDITQRAEKILKEVDIILAEDTRVTQKLLNYLNIKKPIWRCDDYATNFQFESILTELKNGKTMALVTDAGTPNIADPGYKLISFIRKNNSNIKIIPIPGPSALTTAISFSGINANQFTFLGYPPHKKGRKKFFETILNIQIHPIVIFESPHRLLKTLEDLEKYYQTNCHLIIIKELTKIYEEFWEGDLKVAQNYFTGKKVKGEFIIIIP